MPAPLVWAAVAALVIWPLAMASTSPLLGSRSLPYIASGFAGALAMVILLLQPLLAAGYLPGLHPIRARRWHGWMGAGLIACVAIHVVGLYLTSRPDTIDALLLVSPTPFSIYGVTGMWVLAVTGVFVLLRRRLSLRPTLWRAIHNALAAVVVITSVIHALLIEGTMGTVSKWVLSLAVLAATATAIVHLRIMKPAKHTPR